MHRTSIALLTATIAASVAPLGCTSHAPHDVAMHDAHAFFETVSVSGSSFSADESRILISSDASGVFNAYAQPVAGGKPVMLTDSTSNASFGVSWFPRDDRFLFTADQGGNELNHLYVRELDGSTSDLTPGQRVKASFAGWSGDKRHFYVMTNERDPRWFDLYRYAQRGYKRELIFQNDEGWGLSGVSRDGRWIALTKPRTNADSDIYLWDSRNASAGVRHITPHEGNVQHTVMTFSPDSRALYYGTDAGGEFVQAWRYDLESGARERAIADDWDVSFVSFSESGRYRITGINRDASTNVTILDTNKHRNVKLPKLPAGDLRGVRFSPSEQTLAFYVNSDTSPSNLIVYNLKTRKLRQLTQSLNPAIDQHDLVDGVVVRYPSFDGLKIPAILYRPWPASAENRAAALVWVHGGPGGQSRKGYRAEIQHLVNHGYAVLAVNNRGSSGYGKTFFHMDDKKHGDVDLKDCVWGRKYLEQLDWIDADHIGIIGGSYGGYMVAAALAFEPEVFDVGINIFGVTNWLRTLKSIPLWWSAQRASLFAELGDPDKEEQRLRANSPLFHANNIVRPLLVVQGANDPRVLQVESDELVEAARANGVPVEYIVFPDEGHGFRKRENRVTASDAFVKFLDKYLRGNQAADE